MKKSIKHLEIHKGEGVISETESDLYKILESLPDPDVKMKLTPQQKYWWYWFGKEFVSTKQISQLDLIHLQKAAFWMDARCQAYLHIKKKGYKGLVQTFEKGYTNITGHVSIVEKADKHLDEVSAHFGLSIKDRQKLKVEKAPENQLSLFDKFMQQKTS